MAALVEMIVQKIANAAPLENTVSNLVAGVLENTANRLSRFEAAAEGEPADGATTSEQVA
jgi:hypothetical protein